MNFNPAARYLPPLPALYMLLICSGCASMEAGRASHWYRGNTHTHTVLCGHADTAPKDVAAWYHDHGYNFLILSEHNKFIDPDTVEMPENKRDDFILVPGEEVSGAKHVHSTAMNIHRLVPWEYKNSETSKIIQNHVDETIKAGGHAILNHPNFVYAAAAKDILPVKNLYLFELYNGHPSVNNYGNKDHPSTEEMWDELLTRGMKIYGVSSDDAHHFQVMEPAKSNPGRGWVMVNASTLDSKSITEAMIKGNFYASSGVFLQAIRRGPDEYVVRVDAKKTQRELAASPLLRGRHVKNGQAGYRIEFIGPGGKILEKVAGTTGHFNVDGANDYVRAKVTFTQRQSDRDGFEEYYAWGQPIFNDARAHTTAPEPLVDD